LLAVPPEHDAALRDEAARTAIPFTRIGRFLPGVGVRVRDARGDEMIFERKGWSHVR
ncbi:thiamine-phosphate kinase, partial [Endobacter medicaginis]|nr:thiamine-phosphate kinase [Endobacter medicaginis]